MGRDWAPENGGRCEEGETVPPLPLFHPPYVLLPRQLGEIPRAACLCQSELLDRLRRSVAFAFTILHQPACQAGSQSVQFGVVNTPWASRCAAGLVKEAEELTLTPLPPEVKRRARRRRPGASLGLAIGWRGTTLVRRASIQGMECVAAE